MLLQCWGLLAVYCVRLDSFMDWIYMNLYSIYRSGRHIFNFLRFSWTSYRHPQHLNSVLYLLLKYSYSNPLRLLYCSSWIVLLYVDYSAGVKFKDNMNIYCFWRIRLTTDCYTKVGAYSASFFSNSELMWVKTNNWKINC